MQTLILGTATGEAGVAADFGALVKSSSVSTSTNFCRSTTSSFTSILLGKQQIIVVFSCFYLSYS